MGDRGNVAVLQSSGPHRKSVDQVWLYTHWTGTDLPHMVKAGLSAGRPRWDDQAYLTKILFGHVVPAPEWRSETGYGIGCRMLDNEHEIIVVDIPNKRVFTIDEGGLINGKVPHDYTPAVFWPFEEYCQLTELPEI